MHILILSCNTGQGHNTAARAIRENLEKNGDTFEIKNALLFLSQADDKVVCDGHVFIYRWLPKLFGVGYRFEERHAPKFICNQLRRGIKKLEKYLSENSFDAIISTHIFGSILVNELKRKNNLNILSCFIATDYAYCPGAIECNADLYFIPHPKLVCEYTEGGIDENKLFTYGIPVSEQFLSSESSQEARLALGLPLNKHIVFLGCGSMGCGPIVKLAYLLSRRLTDDLIVVACGNNKKFLEKLSDLDRNNIAAIPYTKKMSLYLDAADVFLTKAGGLSTAEAIMKEKPMVYINAVPGCETRNIDFMTSNGYAAAAFSPEEAVNRVVFAINHPESVKRGISACRNELSANPAQSIRDRVCAEVEKRKS